MSKFVDRLERTAYWLLLLLGLASCVSEPLSRNVVRVLMIVLAIMLIVDRRKIIDIVIQYKKFIMLMIAFVAWMIVSYVHGGMPDPDNLTYWFFFNHNMLLLVVVGAFLRRKDQIKSILLMLGISLTLDNLLVRILAAYGVARPEIFLHGRSMQGTMVYLILIPTFLIFTLKIASTPIQRVLGWSLVVMSMISLAMMNTRGAWLSMVIVLTIIAIHYVNDTKRLISIALAVTLLIGIFFTISPTTMQRFKSIGNISAEQSVTERFLMWRSAFNAISDHPILGVGFGQYKDLYQMKYIMPAARELNIEHAHNVFLEFWIENGLPGLITFCALFGYILIWSWRRRRNCYAMMLFTSTLALLLYGLTDYIYTAYGAMRIYWFVMAICARGVAFDDAADRYG